MRFLFIFIDGVGLGSDDASLNPFCSFSPPTLTKLLGGRKLVIYNSTIETEFATLLPLDATLGVVGLPQSATGQTVLLTGVNVPKLIGYHYGPKPDRKTTSYLSQGNIFSHIKALGKNVAFLNAYPPRYFEAVSNGRRLHSAIPLAVHYAGIPLRTQKHLENGEAFSADFTGQGWHDHLGINTIPVISPRQAGCNLAKLAMLFDFAFFEFWLSDYAGHHQDMKEAHNVIFLLDEVLKGLIERWDHRAGLILVTSDHGNMEDLSTRHHTNNPIPLLVIGDQIIRHQYLSNIRMMTDISPAIL